MQHTRTIVQHDGPDHLELWLNQVCPTLTTRGRRSSAGSSKSRPAPASPAAASPTWRPSAATSAQTSSTSRATKAQPPRAARPSMVAPVSRLQSASRQARAAACSASSTPRRRAQVSMDNSPARWPESPRIAMRCTPRASNGPDHLGLRCDALLEHQMARITSDGDAMHSSSIKWQ